MRNMFDQFKHPENRLTHALMSALHEDPKLLRDFVQWVTHESAPTEDILAVEQSLPGEPGCDEEATNELSNGLPDGWLCTKSGWALLIESKIECRLTADQIKRHHATAVRRGFSQIRMLAIVVEEPSGPIHPDLEIRTWTQLYSWLKHPKHITRWGERLWTFMEILETKLPKEGYLKTGSLTVFSGIPFCADRPYDYSEAKRVLRLAIGQLRTDKDLQDSLGVDGDALGRGAITGTDSGLVWDYLRLTDSKEAKNFTEFPHLTLGLHKEYMHAFVIVPNGIRTDFRRNLLGHGKNAFFSVFQQVLERFDENLGGISGAVTPRVELVQRRYPNQRSEPIIDAMVDFDLRTAFPQNGIQQSPKQQTEWLSAVFEALSNRNANLQLAAGVRFTYDSFPQLRTKEAIHHIKQGWITCRPLLSRLLVNQ